MRIFISICFAIGLSLQSFGQSTTSTMLARTIPVPALVEDRSGEIPRGLLATDFSISDEGIEQKVELRNSEKQARSVLLVIQTGHNASSQLGKIGQLYDLLSTLSNPLDQVAILTFDSHPHVLQNFTANSPAIAGALQSITPGDAGAALFDALSKATLMFGQVPEANRRVIILVSGQHDHDSVASSTSLLIRSISLADVAVYGLTFTPPRKELMGKIWSLNPLASTATAMQRNAVAALAQLTGGDFYRFDTRKSFENDLNLIATHILNSYCLAFQPSDLTPGFHSLEVHVRRSKTVIVAARSGYWLSKQAGANLQKTGQ